MPNGVASVEFCEFEHQRMLQDLAQFESLVRRDTPVPLTPLQGSDHAIRQPH